MSLEAEATSFIQTIRAENREDIDRVRKEMRFKVTTVKRSGLDQFQPRTYTPVNLHSIAKNLRKKQNVNREFLAELSQALAENEQNSTIFCGIDGSLQSLCSFLTGCFYSHFSFCLFFI